MNKKIKLIAATTLALLSSIAFADDCQIQEIKKGWTGSIKFKCDNDINLSKNPISIELLGASIKSIWGLPGKAIVENNGNKVTINVEKWWPTGQGYILPSGNHVIISFSPSSPEFSVSKLSVGNNNLIVPDEPTEPDEPTDPDEPVNPDEPTEPSGDYPIYVEGTAYNSGDIVENNGKVYRCKTGVSAWCTGAAWAYEPGKGTAWNQAWEIYDPANPDKPINPYEPTDPDEPTDGGYVTTQAELDKKENELTSSELMTEIKNSIKTRDNSIVEAVKPGIQTNPENVRRVENIFNSIKDDNGRTLTAEEAWEYLFPRRAPEYTYEKFLKAVAKFPAFCGNYSDGRDADAICRKSLATMFAHFTQETGGHTAHWDIPEWRQALVHVREMGWSEDQAGGYNGECNPDTWQGQTWPCGTFKDSPNKGKYLSYFGRGAKQLSYNYNYGPFSQAMYGDVKVLLDKPELVADTWLNLASAVFFFVYPQPPKPSMLHVIDGTWKPNAHDIENGLVPGFGVTTQIINGGVECGGDTEIAQSKNRINYYDNFAKALNVPISNDEILGCKKPMKQFDADGAGATQIFWEQDFSYNADNPGGKSYACKLVGYQTPYSAFNQGDYTKCVQHFFPDIVIK